MGIRTAVSTYNILDVRRELKIQMALRRKLGLFPVQWQCRFRTLGSNVFFMVGFFSFMFYLYLMINKLNRKWVEFHLFIQ